MDREQHWHLCRETGAPVGYLLYRTEREPKERPAPPEKAAAQQNAQRLERPDGDALL